MSTMKKTIFKDMSDVILNSISDGVFTVDKNWNITSFNRAAEEITGISTKEAIGARCSEVLKSSLCGEDCALHQTLKSGKAIINKGCYFINNRGDQIPITISTAVLKDENDNVIGGAETFRDISELERLKQSFSGHYSAGKIASNSPAMQGVLELVEIVAKSISTVLITGATGTGKEVVSRTIHELSDRKEEPFVAVNCAALPENLLESELFGHVKGAFTGASNNKAGLFASAGKGTLLLDEIGDISPAMQVRLLRVLQERTYTPVGSNRVLKSNARIIAATNKNLKELVDNGKFRDDLYYRLNVIKIDMPPLKSRKEDIPLLVENFIDRFKILHNKDINSISPDALSILQANDWPGNIRELENTIERACVVCDSNRIRVKCLPEELKGKKIIRNDGSDFYMQRNSAERDTIIKALQKNNGNRTAAAKELGIHRTTLVRKLKSLDIN